jgi:hypothetical protein
VEVVDPNGPGATELIGEIIAPDIVRAGRTANIRVVVSRRSRVGGGAGTGAAPLLLLESDQPDVLFRTDPGKLWSRSLLLVGGRPGRADRLDAGDTFAYDLQMKAPNRDVRVKLRLRVVRSFKEEMFENYWESLKEASRPAWIAPDVWDLLWRGFVVRLGSNSEQVMNYLLSAALWLESRGAPTRDVEDLLDVAFPSGARSDCAPAAAGDRHRPDGAGARAESGLNPLRACRPRNARQAQRAGQGLDAQLRVETRQRGQRDEGAAAPRRTDSIL